MEEQNIYPSIKSKPDRSLIALFTRTNLPSTIKIFKKSGEIVTNKVMVPFHEDKTYYQVNRYQDIYTTDKYIYALFLSMSTMETNPDVMTREVHQFDWKGNLISKYKVNKQIINFFVSEQDEIIYGLYNSSGKKILYEYSIKN